MRFVQQLSSDRVRKMISEYNLCTQVTNEEMESIISIIFDAGGRTYRNLVLDLAKQLHAASTECFTISMIASKLYAQCTLRYALDGLSELHDVIIDETEHIVGTLHLHDMIEELAERKDAESIFRRLVLKKVYASRRLKKECQGLKSGYVSYESERWRLKMIQLNKEILKRIQIEEEEEEDEINIFRTSRRFIR